MQTRIGVGLEQETTGVSAEQEQENWRSRAFTNNSLDLLVSCQGGRSLRQRPLTAPRDAAREVPLVRDWPPRQPPSCGWRPRGLESWRPRTSAGAPP